jgi:hypothetical protein
MNYLAHGREHLDRPYFLAGTAVPDWLNVSDRRSRVRRKQAAEWCRRVDGEGAVQAARGTALLGKPAVAPEEEVGKPRVGIIPGKPAAHDDVTVELAAGIVRHLDDDAWFHRSAAFYETTGRLTRAVADVVADEPAARPGFVGHVLTEVLLDAALIERDPELLSAYYEALAGVDAERVQHAVNRMAARPAERLALFIRMFRAEQFLRCYLDNDLLTWRMSQVMQRVGLPPLPRRMARVMREMRDWVRERADDLLAGEPSDES